jgi:hypothetical protein
VNLLWDLSEDTAENLEAFGRLDADQAEALFAALKHNVTLIQGPPGTGKSVTLLARMNILHCHLQCLSLQEDDSFTKFFT